MMANVMKMTLLAASATLLGAEATSAAAQETATHPWAQHGALQVSKDGHRIVHRDGTPFLWIGDTAWAMAYRLKREEIDAYLDQRKSQGFNVIQAVAFWYPHGGGMKGGPHNAANIYGHRPFTGGEDSPNTSEPLVVAGGSADAPNDYWDHLDYMVSAARKRGLYLMLLPTWGRAFVTPQMDNGKSEINEAEARVYGNFLGTRYREEPHLIWALGGDTKAMLKGPDKNGKLWNFDARNVYRAMAEGIGQGVTGSKLAWNKADPAWDKLFMTYHPDGDAPDNSSKWFHEDVWLDANGVEVWREVQDVYPVMLKEYQLTNPIKPSLFLEGSYEFGSYRIECGWVTPVKVRRQVYHTFFAGGAGHTYGAGPIWAMRGDAGDYNCGYTWDQALDFPGAKQFAGVAQEFLKSHQWSQWVPDQNVIVGPSGEGASLKTAVVTSGRDLALVYFSNNSAAVIRNTLGKSAQISWFDPRNGESANSEAIAANDVRAFTPPSGWEDAILILRADQ